MNLRSMPKISAPPAMPSIPEAAPVIPTRVGQDLSQGPASGNVGIGLPQHFDPNNPSVRLDGTIHNPTGIGGDLKVSREVSVNDLKNIPVPSPYLPNMPSLGNPFSGLSLPDFSLPDLPFIGTPGMPGFRFVELPEISMPDFDMGEWDLPSPDLIPDWGGDSEESQEEPHKNLHRLLSCYRYFARGLRTGAG
ncbi:MAG: hypothetical protein IPO40_06030 [Fibrobacteres bacterium]|nr:hypothetical protein [Fibrobacterota bacterium]